MMTKAFQSKEYMLKSNLIFQTFQFFKRNSFPLSQVFPFYSAISHCWIYLCVVSKLNT